jgi:polyphosphate:AMP phosphotransferase
MLDKYDLTKKTDDHTFAKEIAPLQEQLGVLQRELREKKIPVIIVVEGWNASGITNVIHEFIRFLDPRGFTLLSTGTPTEDEKDRSFLWRFWINIPAKGRIAIFARSWYSRLLAEQASGVDWEKRVKQTISAINNFERQLTDDNTILLKFFLHISEKEQKKRFNERDRNPLTSWMITKGDWDFHHHYRSFFPVIEDNIRETDTVYAPWTIVEATDPNYTVLKCYTTLVSALEKRSEEISDNAKKGYTGVPIKKPPRVKVKRNSSPPTPVSKPEYQEQVVAAQERVRDLQYVLFKRKIPLVIAFEGWDAAGKGGTIMRLVRDLNPRGYNVMPVSRPNDMELEHHYLWRFIRQYPKAGHTTVFDRSWYGRVLVERVEGLCTENEWKRAYNEINEMEEEYLNSGGGLVKCWLEVSKEEQLRRFHQRENDPLKQWKITDEDWRNREKWDLYETAVDEMLARTSTNLAPWTIIESDDKWYARLKTLRTVISYCETML